MLIRVDSREDALHGLFQINLVGTKHVMRSESLPVGDVILSSEDGETDYIVFERKNLADLAASIRDGRYKEQSLRLQAFPNVPNHNVVYIVEGDFARYNERFSKIGKKALHSAMCSLNYYKGFSVVRTMSIMETYDIIHSYANKLAASPAPYGYYHAITKPQNIGLNETTEPNAINEANEPNEPSEPSDLCEIYLDLKNIVEYDDSKNDVNIDFLIENKIKKLLEMTETETTQTS